MEVITGTEPDMVRMEAVITGTELGMAEMKQGMARTESNARVANLISHTCPCLAASKRIDRIQTVHDIYKLNPKMPTVCCRLKRSQNV